MNRATKRGLWALLVLAVLFAGSALWLRDRLYVDRVEADAAPITVEIESGMSLRAAARRLVDVGLIDADWSLRLVHRLGGREGTVKAGVYAIQPGLSPGTIHRKLILGEIMTVAVTIPEGWTLPQIAATFADSLSIDGEALLQLCLSPSAEISQRLDLPEESNLEGYLFPDTYRFARGVEPSAVVRRMLDRFELAFDAQLRLDASAIGMSPHEVVTLASIVEAEAAQADERTKVAAVYRNRLDKNWRLEADPTVAYAAGVSGEDLTYGHLEMDSPYNTYRHRGLPPGPINSPGEAALRAAVHPEADFSALYFVADGAGGHVFSKTWQEHREAVREYRRKKRAGASGQ